MMADPAYQYSHQPLQRKPMPTHLQPDRQYQSSPMSPTYSHSRSRTTSSSVLPQPAPNPKINLPASPVQQNMYTSRRSPSTNTFSTTASSTGANSPLPNRQSNSDLRRSTSSRSGSMAPPSGYVALMRKQKATVWCDRAQHEDPRIVAAQKVAKMRAAKEVLGSSTGSGRTLTMAQSGSIVGSNRVTAKIRHHGKAGLVGYSPVENFGVGVGGVPMRLSASEVENGDSDEDEGFPQHQRTSSGRSSLGSSRRNNMPYRQSGASGRWSQGNTPPSEREARDSMTDLAGAGETALSAGHNAPQQDEFPEKPADARSTGSGSSGERNDSVAELGDAARLASNSLLRSAAVRREKSLRNPEDLRRRGSVDERTMTMSAQRLYIANPDEDSD